VLKHEGEANGTARKQDIPLSKKTSQLSWFWVTLKCYSIACESADEIRDQQVSGSVLTHGAIEYWANLVYVTSAPELWKLMSQTLWYIPTGSAAQWTSSHSEVARHWLGVIKPLHNWSYPPPLKQVCMSPFSSWMMLWRKNNCTVVISTTGCSLFDCISLNW